MPRRMLRTGDILTRAVRCEMLERRMLLSLSPAGAEFPVNDFTALSQAIPAIAADADGDFVIAWNGNGTGDSQGIFARRFNSAGVAQGGEFRVNSFTTNVQSFAAVAMDADGDFVIVWQSANQDGSGSGVYVQRYNNLGVAQGGEFRVNTTTLSTQSDASVAMDAAGDFVVSWSGYGGAANSFDVFVQRYNSAGVAQGGEARVNTHTTNSQAVPSVAMDSSGDYVIAWQSVGQDGSAGGIYAQRFNASGAAQGSEFRVNSFTTGEQLLPAAAMAGDGSFVIAWQSLNQDGSSYGVYAQRYNPAGVSQGTEFRANTLTTDQQRRPAVALDATGGFLITWQSDIPFGSSHGIFAQSYNAAGVPQGGEFPVNTFSNGQQRDPAVSLDSDGDAIVTWDSGGQDGSGYGIYAQRYDESNPDTAPPMVGGLFVDGHEVFPGQRVDFATLLVLSFSENMSGTGAGSVVNRANYRLTRNGTDVSSAIVNVGFGFNTTTQKYQAALLIPNSLADGSYVLTVLDSVRDVAGNALDGDFDGVAGGSFSRAFAVVSPVAVGPEFRVNVTTSLDQFQPAVAMDAVGNFVVVWESEDQDGSFDGIYARRYSAAGLSLSAEFRINGITTNFQRNPTVARQANGDFVVAWNGFGPGDTEGVFARRYNANGLAKDGIEFRVNTFTTSLQHFPAVAMDSAGNFVIAWHSLFQDGDSNGIYAQRYNAAGVPQGGEFRVNTTTTDNQTHPAVAMDSDGDFVIVWNSGTTDHYEVFAQRYNAAGVPQGVEFRVGNTPFNQFSTLPAVAMDADGDFVVAWENSLRVDAQRFNAAGVALGSQFTVDSNIGGRPSIVCDADGNFIVTWNSQFDSYEVYARRYTNSGVAQSGRFQVNTFTTGIQGLAAVTIDGDGDFVIAWESKDQDGSDYGIYAQRFARLTEVNVSAFLFETAPHRMQFTFNDNVSTSLGIDDIVLQNLTTMQTIPSSDLSLAYDFATNTATFSYIGNAGGIAGVLPDGNYRATLIATGITNSGGTPLAQDHIFNFFFLNGDANHDGRVNLSDFNILASNFGSTNATFSQADFNFSGTVTLADFNLLASRFGQVLGASPDVLPRFAQPRDCITDKIDDLLGEQD